jgi:hypothetical protein
VLLKRFDLGFRQVFRSSRADRLWTRLRFHDEDDMSQGCPRPSRGRSAYSSRHLAMHGSALRFRQIFARSISQNLPRRVLLVLSQRFDLLRSQPIWEFIEGPFRLRIDLGALGRRHGDIVADDGTFASTLGFSPIAIHEGMIQSLAADRIWGMGVKIPPNFSWRPAAIACARRHCRKQACKRSARLPATMDGLPNRWQSLPSHFQAPCNRQLGIVA